MSLSVISIKYKVAFKLQNVKIDFSFHSRDLENLPEKKKGGLSVLRMPGMQLSFHIILAGTLKNGF